MKYEVETKKTLITDNDKRFNVGSDIGFTLKDSNIRYIGEIKEIHDHYMVIHKIELSTNSIEKPSTSIPFTMTLPYDDIKENSCSYVSVD